MTLHQLRVLAAVAKHSNLTRAAQDLSTSPSSVSHQLRLLEEEYGVKLHSKDGRGIRLTQAGQLFLEDTQRILYYVEKLDEDFRSGRSERKAGALTIGGSHSQCSSLLPSVLSAFKEMHPELQLFLQSGFGSEVEQWVYQSEVELGLIVSLSQPQSAALVFEPYRRERLVAVISRSHPLARRRRWSVAKMQGITLVLTKGTEGESLTEQLLKELGREGLTPNVAMTCNTTEATRAAVKAGAGMGVFLRQQVEPDLIRGDLKVVGIPEINEKTVNTYIIYRKDNPLSSVAQDFLALLREWPPKTSWARPN